MRTDDEKNSVSDAVLDRSSVLHRSSTSLINSNSSAAAGVSKSGLSDGVSVTNVANIVSQAKAPISQAHRVSTMTVFDRQDNVHTETDGYFTARNSVDSLVPDGNITNEMIRPNTLGETVFVQIETPAHPMLSLVAEIPSTPDSQSGELCRICHGETSPEAPLIAPCNCSGSMKFVHQECIQTWLKSSRSLSCELCRFTYITGSKLEPLHQWKALELTLLERWKIVCCVMIQLFAICYFILSVEALVRAVKDFHVPQAAMWLWIKIIMSIFGISVSLACTVRQCKTFFRLFRRWQMYNRTVFVKDRTETTEAAPATRSLLGGSK